MIPSSDGRLDNGGDAIRREAPLENFPGTDGTADTTRVNACIECMVREAPTQYLWMHKRFKTRPLREVDVY